MYPVKNHLSKSHTQIIMSVTTNMQECFSFKKIQTIHPSGMFTQYENHVTVRPKITWERERERDIIDMMTSDGAALIQVLTGLHYKPGHLC